jgi:hypothetical protein
MTQFVLVLVLLFSSGDLAVDKISFEKVQDCLAVEKQLSSQFDKDDKVIQYVTGCFPFKKLEKS